MNRNDADGQAPVGHGAWCPWNHQHPWQVFRRPDQDIAADARHLLGSLLLDRRAAVSVSVADGIVTLTGTVPTEEINLAAARLAADVSGVVEVVSRLTTGPVPDQAVSQEPAPAGP
jgi:BON domain